MAWKFGGHDPYRLFHMLDEQYRPVGGGQPRPPRFPTRVQCVIYGFAMAAAEEQARGR